MGAHPGIVALTTLASQFASKDSDVTRSIDGEAKIISTSLHNCHDDVVTDDNGFTLLP